MSDSIKRSIFGVFSENYSKFKRDKNENELSRSQIFRSFFKDSQILTGNTKSILKQILYFNLPYDDIVKNEERPKLLYDCEIQ